MSLSAMRTAAAGVKPQQALVDPVGIVTRLQQEGRWDTSQARLVAKGSIAPGTPLREFTRISATGNCQPADVGTARAQGWITETARLVPEVPLLRTGVFRDWWVHREGFGNNSRVIKKGLANACESGVRSFQLHRGNGVDMFFRGAVAASMKTVFRIVEVHVKVRLVHLCTGR